MREVHITGHLASGPGFVPPSTSDFKLPSIIGHSDYTTKPVFLVFFSVIVISLFFILASRKAAVVPSKLQFAGESIYSFVRKDLGQEIIGAGFLDYVPFLFTLFVFVLVNNLIWNHSIYSIPNDVARLLPICACDLHLCDLPRGRNQDVKD